MSFHKIVFESLHADWPVYPANQGMDRALDTLCKLPPGTRFSGADDIDQCLLLVARDHLSPGHEADPYHPDHHHAAVWHEDLRLLRDNGLVQGFGKPASAEELRDQWAELASELPEDQRGAAWVRAMAFDWKGLLEEEAERDEITLRSISEVGLTVTPKGWARHRQQIRMFEVHPDMERRVLPLLEVGFNEVAVREVAVIVQDSMRRRAGVDLAGQPLLDAYMGMIVDHAGIDGAFQRHVRSELRSLLLCVDLEAGRVMDLEPRRCHTLVYRAARLLEKLDRADTGFTCHQDLVLRQKPIPEPSDEEIPF